MRLLANLLALVSVGGACVALPAESWAWPHDRYRLEETLQASYPIGESFDAALSTFEPLDPTLSFSAASMPQLSVAHAELLESSALDPDTAALDDDIETLDFDLPIARTPKVDRHVQFFSFEIRDRFEQWLSRLERYRPMVQSIFAEFNLPSDLVFLSLVESGFSTNAVSRAKAVGPWQFIKSTAKMYGLRVDNWIDERRDPVKSTVAAARYLRDLYHLFGSWPLAMAAYNAGERKVTRALERSQGDDFWHLTDTKLLKRETKEYVPRFLAAALIAKDPTRYGLNIPPQVPVEFEEVVITRPLHLKTAARAAGVTYAELKALNPELRKDLTPPDPSYHLKVPVGTKAALVANLSKYQDWKRIHATRYQVRRGDTLSRFASRHGSTVEAVLEANVLDNAYRPQRGEWLLVPKSAKAVAVALKQPAKTSR
jgi:membrane-bound lytic murein transglycosylase D